MQRVTSAKLDYSEKRLSFSVEGRRPPDGRVRAVCRRPRAHHTKHGDLLLPAQGFHFDDGRTVEDGVGQKTWERWLKLIDAQKSVLIFDTCESAAATGLRLGREDERETALERRRHATGRSIITAARQAAHEGHKGHGILTYAILDALRAKKGRTDEAFDLYQLADHVEQQGPVISHSVFGVHQHPHNKIEGNFPIGIRSADLPTTETTEIPTTSTHVVISSAIVREKPDLDAPSCRLLDPGTQVRVLEFVGDWAVVARKWQPLGYVKAADILLLQ